MFRKNSILFLCLILIFTGCSINNEALFIKSYKNTLNLNSLYRKTSYRLSIETNKNELSDDEKNISYLLDTITGEISSRYNKAQGCILKNGIISTPSIDFNFEFQDDGLDKSLLLPFYSRYINLGSSLKSKKHVDPLNISSIKKATFINMGSEIIDTPEGAVKVKNLKISLDDTNSKTLILYGLNEALKSTEFTPLNDLFKKKHNVNLKNKLLNRVSSLSVENFSAIISIDKDYRIVNWEVDLTLYSNQKNSKIRSVRYQESSMLWNFNNDNSFTFTDINALNSFSLEDMEKNTPETLESFILSYLFLL